MSCILLLDVPKMLYLRHGDVCCYLQFYCLAVPCHSKRRPSPFVLESQPSLT